MGHHGEGRNGRGTVRARSAGLAFAAILSGSCLIAQTLDSGSVEGRLTDLYSTPLEGARIVLRNMRTGAVYETVAGRHGAYRISGLISGDYVLEATTANGGAGQVSGIIISPGGAVRVQTAVALNGRGAEATHAGRTESLSSGTGSGTGSGNGSGTGSGTGAAERFLADSAKVAAVPAPLPVAGAVGPVANSAIPVEAALANGTGPSAAASLRVALKLPAATQPELETGADPTDLAGRTLVASISAEDVEALPLIDAGRAEVSLDSPPGRSEAHDEERPRTGLREASSGFVRGERQVMAFASQSMVRREMSTVIAPEANEVSGRTMRLIHPGGMAERTESGTRGADQHGRLHGQVFFFDRQAALGARNPFTEWVRESAPGSATTVPVFTAYPWAPADRRTRWGIEAGGPVVRNRVFWFATFDTQRRDHPAVATIKHPENFFAQPSNDEMQVLSARLRLSGNDPVAAGLAAYTKMLETLAGLLGPVPRRSVDNAILARADWNVAQRHRLTLQTTGTQWDSPGGGMVRSSEPYGTHSFGASRGSELRVMGRWEALLNPKLLAITEASAGRHIIAHPAEAPSPFEQTLNVNAWGQLPQIAVDSRYGFTIGNPARFGAGSYPDEHTYAGREMVEWTHGRVQLRAGVDARHDSDATSFVRNHTGTYHYAHLTNFASDALVFESFGLADALDPMEQHNCDQRGKAWRDTDGQLHGLGYLPCFSYYTQRLGPTQWHLETSDVAGFAFAEWKTAKAFTVSAGLRWDRQFTPPPIPLVANPELPLAGKIPSPGNEWAPRASLAWGARESRRPVLRLGYGMYYGRTSNSVLETALTGTGSPKGDLDLFVRPTDNLADRNGGAPPFPYVLAGNPGNTQKAGVVEIAPGFRNAEVHQAVAAVEQEIPGRVLVTVSALATLGRRLPVTMDTNFDPTLNPGTITYSIVDSSGKGPIKSPQITVPFFAAWPSQSVTGGRLNANYQQITELTSRANSIYEAGAIRLSRSARRGLSFNLRYTYAHAMDWNPDEGALDTRASVFDPLDFAQEYGTSNLDIRHSASAYAIWRTPWNLRGADGRIANGWSLAATGQFHSGLPYTMRTEGSLAQEFQDGGGLVIALGPGMNGYGGADRIYGVGRNTYRYPATWKTDLRLSKRFPLGHQGELEILAQSFNLFNHQNVTQIETVGYSIETGSTAGSEPKLNFVTDVNSGKAEFGQPLDVNATDSYHERQFDIGLRLRYKHGLADY